MRLSRLLAVTSMLLAGCVFFSAGWAAPSAGPARVALLVGNADYPDSDAELTTPVNDAEKLGETLTKLGFQIQLEKNVGKRAFETAIDRFVQRLEAGSTSLVFFAGMGMQAGGKNYLIPIDARIWTEEDVAREGVLVDDLLAKIAARKVETRIVIVDASRRNPFERRFRSVSPGLAAPAAGAGIVDLYSAVGALTNDPPAARNSLFVTELIRQIGDPERNVAQAFAAVRDEIIRQTKNQQVPRLDNGLAASYWLDGNRRAAEEPAKAAPKAPEPPLVPVKQVPPPAKAPEPAPAVVAPKPAPKFEAKEYSAAEQTAKADLDARIARDPGDEASISRRGQLLALHREYSAALADFDMSTRLNPDNVESWNNRCWIRAIANEVSRALEDCNEALRRRPKFTDALDSRGLVRLKQGDPKTAIEDYNEALKIDPRHASSLYGRGLARLRLGQADKAGEDMAKARTLNPAIESDYKDFGLN